MKSLLFILSLSVLLFSACDEEEDQVSCYDASIVHNGVCTTDCPGFEGCDGNTYCNECEAARLGIGPM